MNDQPNQPDRHAQPSGESSSPSHKTYRLRVPSPEQAASIALSPADSLTTVVTPPHKGPHSTILATNNPMPSDTSHNSDSESSEWENDPQNENDIDPFFDEDDPDDDQAAVLPAPRERVASIDALRGFDMFWIIGAAAIFEALKGLIDNGAISGLPDGVTVWLTLIMDQLTHVSWEGFHFYDLIFPMFVFITGASMVFSITKRLEDSSKGAVFVKIIWRTLFLYLLGLFYYAGMEQIQTAGELRYMGVLQRIAIAYGVTATLYLFLPVRALFVVFAVILLGYYGAMAFVPFEGSENLTSMERFEEGADRNLVNHFDSKFLKGYKWGGNEYDPEGLLSNIPAVGSCLLGVFAGLLLINGSKSKSWKFSMLVLSGIISLGLAFGWSLFFPIIKNLWTSSFVLMAGGWSLILLAIFYLVIDIWKFKFWAMPFIWVGSNAITIYMLWQFVDFQELAGRIIQFEIASALGAYAEMATALLALFFALALLRYLCIKKVFMRI